MEQEPSTEDLKLNLPEVKIWNALQYIGICKEFLKRILITQKTREQLIDWTLQNTLTLTLTHILLDYQSSEKQTYRMGGNLGYLSI